MWTCHCVVGGTPYVGGSLCGGLYVPFRLCHCLVGGTSLCGRGIVWGRQIQITNIYMKLEFHRTTKHY